ncbi:MAG: hypothetical protein GY841_16270 [FCB group bacterium]|nr:hypothetical protein [FCB group bacterium]
MKDFILSYGLFIMLGCALFVFVISAWEQWATEKRRLEILRRETDEIL